MPKRTKLVGGVPPSRDSGALGVGAIRHRVDTGDLVKLGRGAYAGPAAEWSPHRDELTIALARPGTVFSHLSALHLHGMLDAPAEVWISIGHHDRRPKVDIPLEVVRCSAEMLEHGVVSQVIEGTDLRVTTVGRTVVDCFKARNKVGLDVAVQALTEARRLGLAASDDVWVHAQRHGMCEVMSPYMRIAFQT
jgi:predicted transcriptional regulator of viral defense system